jgi:streptogramin lyase
MNFKSYAAAVLCFAFLMVSTGWAVTSAITRHNSSADFLKGKIDDAVIDSTGKIHLAPKTTPVETGELLKDVWSIHTMVTDADGAVYLGTGPDAAVLRYADGKVEKIYPAETAPATDGTTILNQHVFAMAKDLAGRLLIGVSGEKGQLIRLAKTPEVVFEDEKVQYIYAIALDEDNNVYLATGPNGRIYRLNAFCQNPEIIYEAKDKNILSLLVKDGVVYAGGDERGLVYRINPAAKSASVLYDTDQNEVVSLLMDHNGNVYAAATSAAAAMLQLKAPSASMKSAPGRPDVDKQGENGEGSSGTAINTANGDEAAEQQPQQEEASPERKAPTPPAARLAGHIYRIDPDGFVTDLFSEIAVFYAMLEFEGRLWLGTGGKAELYTITPATEEKSVFYKDKTSSQITSLLAVGDTLYLGLSNPARLVAMKKEFVLSGVYTSDLVDAGQPARWGKLQIEADIPDGTEILLASRSGNVSEPNDPTFSDWTSDVAMTRPTDLNCPLGRYCQYRLTLKTTNPAVSPIIREAAVASVIPNLSPKVTAVRIQRSRDKNKPTIYEVAIIAADDNKDTLEYTLEFRKMGRTLWIPLKDELEASRFEWDSRTVEDGRYEVRVTANDRKSNTAATTLTGSRVSDPVVLDNTAPEITEHAVTVTGGVVELTLSVADAFTMIGKVQYTVDSNEQWMGTLPADMVYDTRAEEFTIRIDDLKPGMHVIAVSVSDDLDNTRYQTFEVTVP